MCHSNVDGLLSCSQKRSSENCWLHVQTLIDDLEDASNELMLADEEEVGLFGIIYSMTTLHAEIFSFQQHCPLHCICTYGCRNKCAQRHTLKSRCHDPVQVRFSVGDCFYHASPDEAEEKLQEGGEDHPCSHAFRH